MLSRSDKSNGQGTKAAGSDDHATEEGARPGGKGTDDASQSGKPAGKVETVSDSAQVSVGTADQGFQSV